MSLLKFLKIKDVKKKFQEYFSKTRFAVKKEILAPPLTKNYGRVGTAFDYLLRFYLKYLNPQTITHRWVAELSLERLKKIVNMKKSKLTKDQRIVLPLWKDWYTKGKEELTLAKERYTQFLETGQVTDGLIKSTIYLAKLDSIYRAGYIKKNFEYVDKNDIKDLKNLISLINQEEFKPNNNCILNPTFGNASIMVGGADADLVIDEMLIDIKTTKIFQMKREYYDQLIGYYTLYRIDGIDSMPGDNEIKKLGVYFSRHGYLHLYNIEDIIDENKFPEFIEWFKDRATQEYGRI